jgi:hypothetical protein
MAHEFMDRIAQPSAGVNAPAHSQRIVASQADAASTALVAANAVLLARRSQLKFVRQDAPSAQNVFHTEAVTDALPAHLGWEHTGYTELLRRSVHGNSAIVTQQRDLRIAIRTPSPKPTKTTVKAYPSILNALLKQEQAAAGRVWLLCRHLDVDGRGWIDVTDLRQALTKRKAEERHASSILYPLCSTPIFGWRRLRQILGQGKGIFWNRDEHGRLWIFGAARVAANLDVERLQNRPIQLPVSELTGTMGQVRAVFYAAFHAGRQANQPISRTAIAQATGVPARTQFHYEETARIKRRKNYTIGAGWGSVSAENSAYQHGNAVFEFIDHRGRHGKCGQTYAARQLPNSYSTRLETCTRGRQRKVNARLADLVTWGAGERPEKTFTRLYYRDGSSAVGIVAQAEQDNALYWPQSGNRLDTYALWHCRFGR